VSITALNHSHRRSTKRPGEGWKPQRLRWAKVHTCFGKEGELAVFEVWETQEAYDAHTPILFPILEEVGIKLARPADVVPIVSLHTT
jgi:hypothetical protein